MKRLALALAVLAASAAAASAATIAVATGNVNLRAGPSTAYPVVSVVPAGVQVAIHGCLAGYTWCDISLGAFRGWVSADYIQVVHAGAPVALTPLAAPGIAVVTFGKVYWDAHYAAYPWYRRWAYYGPYAVGRPIPHGRAVACAGGTCTGTVAYGSSVTRTRSCSRSGQACTLTRTGPAGNTASRTIAR